MNGGDALRCVPSTHRQPGRPNAPATEHAAAGSLPEKGPAHGLHKRWPRAEKATKHQHRPPCMHNLGQPVLPLFPAHSSGRAKQTCPSLAAPPLHRPRGSSKRPHASRRPEVHDTTAEGGGSSERAFPRQLGRRRHGSARARLVASAAGQRAWPTGAHPALPEGLGLASPPLRAPFGARSLTQRTRRRGGGRRWGIQRSLDGAVGKVRR